MKWWALLAVISVVVALCSCGGESSTVPRPRAYPRIDFPAHVYEDFALAGCPFRFEKPVYTTVEREKLFFHEEPPTPCWFDLVYPQLNARIHFTYYASEDVEDLFKHINDAFKMAGKHTMRANYIDERVMAKPGRVYGRIFEIEGPAATPLQFYLTDSVQHFLRGALYVRARIRTDSLAPVYDFIKEDLAHLLNTFEWKSQ